MMSEYLQTLLKPIYSWTMFILMFVVAIQLPFLIHAMIDTLEAFTKWCDRN